VLDVMICNEYLILSLFLNKVPLNHTHTLHKAGLVRNPNPKEDLPTQPLSS